MRTGMVANQERYTLNDGLGIRTTVFLKGCPLRCRWCCNPETQSAVQELMFFQDNCIDCGACLESCPYGGAAGSPVPEWDICRKCQKQENPFTCISSCFTGCRKLSGEKKSVQEVIDFVKRDMNFYLKSGGGVTISGGEPLSQPEFLRELLKLLHENWIDTAIETCGAGTAEAIEMAAPYVDMVFFDIKCIDADKHRIWTGADNRQILENFRRMAKLAGEYSFELIARTPVIPEFNDTEYEIRKIGEFIKSCGSGVSGYELLPYHKLGRGKYKAMGREYEMENVVVPSEALMEKLTLAAGDCGVEMCTF